MKHLILLYTVTLVFILFNLPDLNDYTISIEGPPPTQNGLPRLTVKSNDESLFSRRELLPSKNGERGLIYKFYLKAGTYRRFDWNGFGVPLPATLSVHDYWDNEAMVIKTDGVNQLLKPPGSDVFVLPSASYWSMAKWIIAKNALWILCLVVFLVMRKRLSTWTRRLLNISPERLRWGKVDGKLILLTALALMAVWVTFLIPGALRFEVGDDPAMEMLASGYVTGHPSEYLVFINVLLGLVLKGLYVAVPAIPWYPVLLLGVLLVCLVGITALLLQDDCADRFCWLFLFGVIFGLHFLAHLQFTVVAYIVGLFGMLIFSQKTSRLSLALAVVFVVGGSLIRFDAFFLLVGTTGAAAWLLSKRRMVDKILFVAACLSLVYAGQAFDKAYYKRDPEWQAYREFNAQRGGLHITPKLNFGEKNKPVFAHIGWSENDFKMFDAHWLYEDPQTYTTEKLTYLNQNLTSDMNVGNFLFILLVVVALGPAPILVFLTLLFHRWENPERSLFRLAIVVGPTLLILGYLSLSARIPERVVVPTLYGTCLFLLLSARENGTTCRLLKRTTGLPLMFVTLMFLAVGDMWRAAAKMDLAERRLDTSLGYLAPYSDKTFIGSINAVILEWLEPVTGLAQARKVNIIHLMWSGGSPSFALQLRQHGLTSLFQDMASNPNVWLMVPTVYWDRSECFSTYMEEHYHQKIKLAPVVLSDGKTAVFPDFAVMRVVPEGQP